MRKLTKPLVDIGLLIQVDGVSGISSIVVVVIVVDIVAFSVVVLP